ncbi:hypothetical protein [Gemella morbillorum]|uniref:hypothetical protein n=1 Tax=Gemella morbillorum TaxID=29391 RepID=UPI0023F1B913|nr:hypothetical protein [Gemella morbillorum]
MKHDDFGLYLKKASVDENEIEASAKTIITTTIVLSALNKCTSAVNPTGGMAQGCCNRNIEKIETESKLRYQ